MKISSSTTIRHLIWPIDTPISCLAPWSLCNLVSNNLNKFIQRLTVVTIILMVPTLVGRFYGMNLKYLPLEDNPMAFYYILFLSVLLIVFLVWFFRHKQMF
ncbi:MAG: hypothetical protein IPK94_05485 [Saprospiraceae bacterium]|nr:hypothetical protein [Saprospiraceae bacterium]